MCAWYNIHTQDRRHFVDTLPYVIQIATIVQQQSTWSSWTASPIFQYDILCACTHDAHTHAISYWTDGVADKSKRRQPPNLRRCYGEWVPTGSMQPPRRGGEIVETLPYSRIATAVKNILPRSNIQTASNILPRSTTLPRNTILSRSKTRIPTADFLGRGN